MDSMMPPMETEVMGKAAGKPRVVILGGGFGGLSAAVSLAEADAEVVLVDRRNYHLFQPLLYQVAAAALNPSDIAQPIRGILRGQKNTTVLLGEVDAIDRAARIVHLSNQRALPYDWLIVGTGARHSYFGHPEWEECAPGLKDLDDATAIRRRILRAFETAEDTTDMAERERLLTFVIVGAGPTGVEMAGAIAELARHALPMDFRRIDPTAAKIILVDAAPRVLPAFPESLSAAAAKALEALGVELRLGASVSMCAADHAVIDGAVLPTRTILWAAGVAASPAARWLNSPADRTGRVIVDAQLHPENDPRILWWGIRRAASASMASRYREPRLWQSNKASGRASQLPRALPGAPRPNVSFTNMPALWRRLAGVKRWLILAASAWPGFSPGCCGVSRIFISSSAFATGYPWQ